MLASIENLNQLFAVYNQISSLTATLILFDFKIWERFVSLPFKLGRFPVPIM